jgi:hypothetical protein
MSKLTDFLLLEGTNTAGLRFSDVMYLRTADFELEHDFIQWIFPLPEPSKVIPTSPVLTQEDYTLLQNEYYPLGRLVQAKHRYLRFLEEYDRWMAEHDHNHLRITRAIKCLSLFRGQEYATSFLDAVYVLLGKADRDVTKDVKLYWTEAQFYRENQRFIKWK